MLYIVRIRILEVLNNNALQWGVFGRFRMCGLSVYLFHTNNSFFHIQAEKFDEHVNQNPVVAIKGAKVSDFGGKYLFNNLNLNQTETFSLCCLNLRWSGLKFCFLPGSKRSNFVSSCTFSSPFPIHHPFLYFLSFPPIS